MSKQNNPQNDDIVDKKKSKKWSLDEEVAIADYIKENYDQYKVKYSLFIFQSIYVKIDCNGNL